MDGMDGREEKSPDGEVRAGYNGLLLEFKYVSLKDLKLTGEQVRGQSMAELAALAAVQAARDAVAEQARRYAAALAECYGLTDLRRFAVVGIGLERVVWQAIQPVGPWRWVGSPARSGRGRDRDKSGRAGGASIQRAQPACFTGVGGRLDPAGLAVIGIAWHRRSQTAGSCGLTVNSTPRARMTESRVLRVGFPCSLNERYSCSRDRPVALANSVMPLARATTPSALAM